MPDAHATPDEPGEAVDAPSTPEVKRINIAVNPETVEILEYTIDTYKVSLTEAVRRLIGVGHHVTELAKVQRVPVIAAYPDGDKELLVL